MGRAGLIVVLVALAACGARSEKEAPDLTIGPDGVGGLTSPAPLTVAHVQGAFPGYTLAPAEGALEGARYRKLAVKAGDEVLAEILPSPDGRHVGAVLALHPRVKSPQGEAPGVARLSDAPAGAVAYCQPELVAGAPARACSTDAQGRFWRLYAAPPTPPGPPSELSAARAEDVRLIGLRWVAPPP